ncbi:MAG: DUF2436 domain-containing protein, partial [Bacteroidales bacterium]|nr:DUF2436 domain-containing protein [Bacteroidales bacterium]
MKRLLNMKKSLNIFLAVVFLVTGVTTAQNARFSTLIKANEKAKLSVVKKAGKPGVATITMIVIDPYPMGAGGFQMVLDKDALLADDINNYFDSIAYTMDWGIVYSDYGDYFIPEGATPTLDNPEVGTHEDTISIEVPPGIYDYVVTQLYVDYGIIAEVMGQDYLPCRVNNFEFQAGYEYVFTLEYSMLSLAVEYDAALTSITLPAPSADLTQDAVKVTLKNAGKHSFSNVELSYSVNDSTPVVETFTDTLEPGGITTYTFNTVADFSQTGVYEVTATVNYNEDLNLTNNTIFGSTEKIDTTPDLTFAGVIVPRNSCELGTENTLGVKVSNIGTLNCTKGFTLSYKVGNSAAVQQTFTQTIEKNATETIYFDVKADLSAVNNHEIIFTVSTPVDKDTSNNEIRAIVRHYAPVTELPFESVFANEAARNDWYVGEGEILGISNGWAYDSMGEPARLMYQVGSDMPLLSRCITFAPGLYRFAFSYRGGFFSPFGGANTYTDFYVAYGKSGTDPKLWTPAKEYNDCLTRDPVTGEILINITEQGDYVFGIFPKNLEVIRLYSVSISNVLEHDMRINSVVVPESIARLMPKSQIAGEKTFALTVENFGATAAESGTVELKLGATVLASENISFDSLAQVKNVNITADFETLSAGSKKLIFEAKTNNNVTSRQEISFTVSDSVFAWDNLDNGFGASVGHRAPGGLGVVYEISNE